jgi:hypothetical protein
MLNQSASEAVRVFDRDLNNARREWDRGTDSGRRGMVLALAAAAEFISSIDRDAWMNYSELHMVLIAALHALNEGVVEPLLRPRNIGRGRRSGFPERQLKWHAAATMRALMDLGISRASAAISAADVLRRGGLPSGTARGVANCYDKEKQNWYGVYVSGAYTFVIGGIRKNRPLKETQKLILKNLADTVARWQSPPSL